MIYRQRRVGRAGRSFEMLKLRTMVQGAERDRRGPEGQRGRRADHAQSERCCVEPRSTSCRTSSTCCAARCRSSARGRRFRPRSTPTTPTSAGALLVRPGITGWAQVNGRASLPWEERIELDLWYIDHRSLALDAQHPVAHRSRRARRRRSLQGRQPAAGRGSCDARDPAHRGRQALRHRLLFRGAHEDRRGGPRAARAGALRGRTCAARCRR